MPDIKFEPSQSLTLGVEIELQLLDQETYDLRPSALELIDIVGDKHPKIKPEIFQSMLEVNTEVCSDVHHVKNCISQTFSELNTACNQIGIKYATTGTHPFARYSERILYPLPRYNELIDRNQWIARRLSIFGLHVHIGIESQEECIGLMNFMQHFLPQLAALSCSSPFWQSKDTGLYSSRLSVFEASPTSGHCDYIKDWQTFSNIVHTLKECKAIKSTKDLWWDIRPAPHYGSLEIRICDGTATFHELLGIVAYIHVLAHYYHRYKNYPVELFRLINNHETFIPLWIIRENKWRAMRHGINMETIKHDGTTLLLKDDTFKNLEILKDIISELNYGEYIGYIINIFQYGNSANRQLKKYKKAKSLRQVAKMNASECYESFLNNKNCII
ncbi:MAG: YbdK family carboxylate-amine ligase [Alphaproteobacteria bacterium]|nr:YbdK family carboxylate-amine ligase [Alphaproteobacteria bacterium]OJV15311.1 MAG: hypothetical protein BGO27_02250 [Alphaproteobacteria bacterium 33-17]